MMHAENLENEFHASFINCKQNEGAREGCGGEEVNVEEIREEGVG
jgi:hypothetical protein